MTPVGGRDLRDLLKTVPGRGYLLVIDGMSVAI
jgi:hypothetical protein